MAFADPVVKLNPHIAGQTNHRWFAGLKGDFILTKRAYRGITDQLFETLVVILEPGWNIPAHLFVGCKQEARPKSIVGVNLRQCRTANPDGSAKGNQPSQPASPGNAHAFTGDAGYERSRNFRLGRTFLLRFRTKTLL